MVLLARVLAGYVFNRRPTRLFEWRFARRRLVWATAAVLSLLGAFFFYQVSLLAVDVIETSKFARPRAKRSRRSTRA